MTAATTATRETLNLQYKRNEMKHDAAADRGLGAKRAWRNVTMVGGGGRVHK